MKFIVALGFVSARENKPAVAEGGNGCCCAFPRRSSWVVGCDEVAREGGMEVVAAFELDVGGNIGRLGCKTQAWRSRETSCWWGREDKYERFCKVNRLALYNEIQWRKKMGATYIFGTSSLP